MGWTNPTPLQRLEGLALLAGAIWIFATTGEAWWLFVVLLLVPDISMLGYLAGPSLGAITYNLGHTLLGPAALLAWGFGADLSIVTGLGAVWLGHIGMDRLAGYGLKYPDAFTHTHLGLIGPAKRGNASSAPK